MKKRILLRQFLWDIKNNWGLRNFFFPLLVQCRIIFNPKKYSAWWKQQIYRYLAEQEVKRKLIEYMKKYVSNR